MAEIQRMKPFLDESVSTVLGVGSTCVNGELPATTTDECCRWRSTQREPGSFFAVSAEGFASTPWLCKRVDFATGESCEVDDGSLEPGHN